ncbi:hypothetical protein Emed_001174 [Eimeria media]
MAGDWVSRGLSSLLNSFSLRGCAAGAALSLLFCLSPSRLSPVSLAVASEAPEAPEPYGAGALAAAGGAQPPVLDQLSSMLSSVVPVVSQLLGPAGEGPLGSPSAGGGKGGLGVLLDLGKRAAGALSTSMASDEAREELWVPIHEQLGVVRDYLGLPADDAEGVRSAARLLTASQLPILRFAAERELCSDSEADQKALRLVVEYPAAKKMLTEYFEQPPDRNIRAAPADLAAMYSEMKDYLSALRAAGEKQVLPVSILGGLDHLSSDAAVKISAYLGTVSRYFLYGDRFAKNKKGLVFFARHVLPRILQLFALQLDACRYLWLFLSAVSPSPALSLWDTAAAETGGAAAASSTPLSESDAAGALGAIAQNLGFKLPAAPYAHGRAFGRRLLARVQLQISAIHSLSRGCLAATSLAFQRDYAEAQERVELGESPASAFQRLLEQSEQLQLSPNTSSNSSNSSGSSGGEAAASAGAAQEQQAAAKEKANHRLRALARRDKQQQQQQQTQTQVREENKGADASQGAAATSSSSSSSSSSGSSSSSSKKPSGAAGAASSGQSRR